MADRGAKARVVAGLQRGDALFRRLGHRLGKVLDGLHEDPVPLQRGKGVDREIVAAGVKTPGQRRQRLTFDVDHGAAVMAVAGYGAFGGPRDVQQDRHRQIAPLRPCLAPDAVGPLATSPQIDLRAHRAFGIKLIPVRVAGGGDQAGPQRLELAADGADAGAGLRIGAEGRHVPAFLGAGVQDAGMGGQVDAGAHVPFGVKRLARKRLAVHILGREVKVQLQPRRGRF